MSNEITMPKNTLLFAGIFLAIVLGGYVVFGATSNTGQNTATANQSNSAGSSGIQKVYIHALGSGGYENPQVTVKQGVPVELHFKADSNTGCGRALILDGFNVQLVSRNGEDQVATFTPQQPGTYAFHCGMNMYRGQMVVQ